MNGDTQTPNGRLQATALAPCECGGRPVVKHFAAICVFCDTCGASGPMKLTSREATEAWNRSAPSWDGRRK